MLIYNCNTCLDIHDELDTKISALEERFNDLRDELGAKISALEERFNYA
ncbi:31932_t:CDS:2 [Gigaspora margarita]|uniref:31932_t:CDS:1 n=1 Tax=Gigaspora margarita TaxID=4874 RepID=A0ABN7V474_GIGMA|nr:31932_t:CDS:2 [Gigaspora margarita]